MGTKNSEPQLAIFHDKKDAHLLRIILRSPGFSTLSEQASEGLRNQTCNVACRRQRSRPWRPRGVIESSAHWRGHEREYMAGAISLDGSDLDPVIEVSQETGVFIVTGLIERLGNTLYCTTIMVDPNDGLVGKHRKLMPTASERLIWGFGDGSTLDVVESPTGRLGTAICWENYMPLFRQAMYSQGVEIHCAPTVDNRDAWQSTMQHIALEGRTFVLSSCQLVRVEDYPEDTEFPNGITANGLVIRGGSVIYSPLGEVLAGPVYGEETIRYADIDLSEKDRSHLDLDAVGHYARPDVFQLHVNTAPQSSVVFE
ncbi:carbon-nitrogen hydrolase family protein [Flaviflexus ciconiae]|uniref:Carbon-nitrogen hydrolase family protein n=1 Tax=Flaviflexus ciconiae TaxID=2496867 RepID=A0A3Q9G368_9ACTO|nr:carbon-nitrogen hydrolase family protein [Flaviflexus ciconiae]AZQ76290.1 carbon-nitrogen hydrolase family protein [Flaviflexus ciconiae]